MAATHRPPADDTDYDFWLFDLDGTLVDVEWAYVREVFDAVGDRMGRTFTDREAETLWHGLCESRNDQLRRWDVDVDRFWTVFHDVEDPAARAAATYLHDDAELVAALDAPVGLVTHCQRYLTDPVLDAVGIRDWFDDVVCCTEDLGWKPDPEPVEHAMANLGVDGRHGSVVGDGVCDVGAAWNAGLDGIHVERHGPERRGQCVLADRQVSSLADLR